jgi:ligand-binding sensor domain-containing protein/two-component sensor histidine kinase
MFEMNNSYYCINPIRLYLVGWGFFISCLYLQSQPNDLYFHHLGLAQGLSQSTNGTIFKDSYGFVWIGSAEGLNRFDGIHVKVYKANPSDSTQLADPIIISNIFEDTNHDLWFSTFTAIHHYRRKSDDFSHIILKDENGTPIKNNIVFHLSPNGILLAQENGKVFSINTKEWAISGKINTDEIIKTNGYIFHFFENKVIGGEGDLYVSEIGKLNHYLLQSGKTILKETLFDGKNGYPNTYISSVIFENKSSIWVCSGNSIYHCLPNAFPLKIDNFMGNPIGETRKMVKWGENYLFLTSVSGLYLLDKNKHQIIKHWEYNNSKKNALSSNVLSFLMVDLEDNLWLSSWTKGVDYTNLKKIKFQTNQPLVFNQQNQKVTFVPGPILQDKEMHIWGGSQLYGLLEMDTMCKLLINHSNKITEPDQLFNLSNGNILANNFYKGLSIYNPVTKKRIDFIKMGKSFTSFVCQISEDEFLVTQKEGNGLFILLIKNNTYTFESLNNTKINEFNWEFIVKIRENEYLMANSNYTLFYFDKNKSLKEICTMPGFITSSLVSGNDIWLGNSLGLMKLNYPDFKYQNISTQDGLPSNMVYAIERISDKEFWLSTGQGLVRYNPIEKTFRTFSMADGLQEMEFNRSSSLLTKDGTLWFGGINGYNVFKPDSIDFIKTLPKIQFTYLRANDQTYLPHRNPCLIDAMTLPYDSSTIEVGFAALEFSDPQNNQLKYKLSYLDGKPYDVDWVNCPITTGFARYAKLPPGQYQLQILAANSDGIWNPTPKTLNINILPPWWQTWWFRTLAFLTIAASAYGFYRYRLQQLRTKLEAQNKMSLLELSALRSQLNPHFIANSLVAINYYIRNNGVEKVHRYVNTLARLMRDVLNSARNITVPLEDEIRLLRNYVEVESGQFQQPIEFEVTVQEGLDTSTIEVPGMILQPFVENAIKHGLKPREGKGKISLLVQKEADYLLFTIIDNGVGRKHKTQQNDKANTETKSHGLQITKERLHLYDAYAQTKAQSGFEIVDLVDMDGTLLGTQVNVRLALMAG